MEHHFNWSDFNEMFGKEERSTMTLRRKLKSWLGLRRRKALEAQVEDLRRGFGELKARFVATIKERDEYATFRADYDELKQRYIALQDQYVHAMGSWKGLEVEQGIQLAKIDALEARLPKTRARRVKK